MMFTQYIVRRGGWIFFPVLLVDEDISLVIHVSFYQYHIHSRRRSLRFQFHQSQTNTVEPQLHFMVIRRSIKPVSRVGWFFPRELHYSRRSVALDKVRVFLWRLDFEVLF